MNTERWQILGSRRELGRNARRADAVSVVADLAAVVHRELPGLVSWEWLAEHQLASLLGFGGAGGLSPWLLNATESPSGWRVRVLWCDWLSAPWTVATFNVESVESAAELVQIATAYVSAVRIRLPIEALAGGAA